MTVEELKWKKFPVLNDGFVCLVDVMGDDSSVVQAARVSYGEGTKKISDDRTLIRYLLRHRHTTPFEMVELKFLVRVPMDCWRQWIRHRTASVNEYSTRYSIAIDEKQKTEPEEWRAQAVDNKQGSAASGELKWPTLQPIEGYRSVNQYLTARESGLHVHAAAVYEERIAAGVAREQARKDLPLSTYTEAYWKIDLHNLLHFLALRMDSHAQKEIRDYATIIGEQIVKPLFPMVWEAFADYRLESMTLSRMEVEALRNIMENGTPQSARAMWMSDRERDEFFSKLSRFGITARVTTT